MLNQWVTAWVVASLCLGFTTTKHPAPGSENVPSFEQVGHCLDYGAVVSARGCSPMRYRLSEDTFFADGVLFADGVSSPRDVLFYYYSGRVGPQFDSGRVGPQLLYLESCWARARVHFQRPVRVPLSIYEKYSFRCI